MEEDLPLDFVAGFDRRALEAVRLVVLPRAEDFFAVLLFAAVLPRPAALPRAAVFFAPPRVAPFAADFGFAFALLFAADLGFAAAFALGFALEPRLAADFVLPLDLLEARRGLAGIVMTASGAMGLIS